MILHVAVHYFYCLVKSMYAGQQFACGRKKDIGRKIAIVLALASHVSLDHTLFNVFFLLFFLLSRSTVCQIMALALELLYVYIIDYTCRWIGASTYIHTVRRDVAREKI